MRSEMNDLLALLDEHVVKGFTPEPLGRVTVIEETITKSLSHNPFDPVVMNDEVGYYNPYRQLQDGSFAPHPVSHWEGQGKSAEHYETTRQMYKQMGVVEKSLGKLKHLGDLVKAELGKGGAVPVGTVHTYRDGQKYKKVKEGGWQPVGQHSEKMKTWLTHPNPEYQRQASQEIERHGTQVSALEDMIKRKEANVQMTQEATQAATKEVLGHMKKILGHLFDGAPPKEIQEQIDKMEQKDPDAAKVLQDLTQEISGKPKHDVHMKFLHNGKRYQHKFEGVEAAGHHDAINKVAELLQKKLKGAQITGAQAMSVKGSKDQGQTPKESQQ